MSSHDEEPVGYVISRGRIADFLLGLAFPAIAWPGQSLYRIVLHGHGFVWNVEILPEPWIGFYVTYFVAARDVRTAEATAQKRLRDRWDAFYADDVTGELIVEIDDIEQLEERFLARSRYGMAFYRGE